MNAGGVGDVAEFRWHFGLLAPTSRSRSLGPSDPNPPFFTLGPDEVGHSPGGTRSITAEKNSTNQYRVFSVAANDALGAAAVDEPAQNNVPFAFVFVAGSIRRHRGVELIALELARNANGTLTFLAAVSDGRAALCGVATAHGYFYGSNAAGANVSSFSVAAGGTVTLVNADADSTQPGTTDRAVSPDGIFLYVESGGSGALDVLDIGANDTLNPLETLWNISAASEGLAVS